MKTYPGEQRMAISGAPTATYSLIAKRNCSLSTSGRHFVLALVSSVTFGIALVFATLGAWLILPFAGLEVLVLYLAFRYIERHACDYERISIAEDKLLLEFHEAGDIRRVELNCFWACIQCDARQRLTVRSHGREIEFGRHLTGRQRVALARRLKKYLGTAYSGGV